MNQASAEDRLFDLVTELLNEGLSPKAAKWTVNEAIAQWKLNRPEDNSQQRVSK